MTKQKDDKRPPRETPPPEGPHAKPRLVDPQKTPGSGMFPKPGTSESEPPSG